MIHLYPAKLLPHIAAFFLASSELSSKGDKVLDPFSGSGTVLLEALLAGRSPIGADSNPLARLISKVKMLRQTTGKVKPLFGADFLPAGIFDILTAKRTEVVFFSQEQGNLSVGGTILA
jgi:hypothetical protein